FSSASCCCSAPVTSDCALDDAPTIVPLFFFTDPATSETYTLSLHDALPIFARTALAAEARPGPFIIEEYDATCVVPPGATQVARSEEHTSELQSLTNLVCRLLLEKKKTRTRKDTP